MAAKRKQHGVKTMFEGNVWSDESWSIRHGELRRPRGRPAGVEALFRAVAEKIPFGALDAVRRQCRENGIPETGVYVAHDSMGVARYIGRGKIFSRLRARQRAQRMELVYFSFYVVAEKNHEREIETLLIRSAGPQLHFNDRKKRVDIQPGSVKDYEAGTMFFERQYRRGRRPSTVNRRGRPRKRLRPSRR